MTNVSNNILSNKGSDTEEMVSVLKKFHKDFKESNNKSLLINKARNEREIDEKKRQKLGNITNTSVTNVSNITKDKSGSSISSIIIPATKGDVEVISELKGINKTIIKSGEKESKNSKSVFKNSILQARVLEGGFNFFKDFLFAGASDTDRIVNSVNNVEQAILKGDKIVLDERSKFQKIAETLIKSSILGKAGTTSPTAGTGTSNSVISGFINSIMDQFETSPTAGTVAEKITPTSPTAGTGTSNSVISGFINSIMDQFETSSKDPKVKKSSEKASTNIAEGFVDMLDKGITGILGSSLLNKKSGFLGAVALFGSSTDFALSTAILNPLKTFKLAYVGFKKSLGLLVDRPLLQGIALATSTFGAFGGVIATVLLPLSKIIRPLTKELPSLGDAFGMMRDKITDTTKGLKKGVGNMLSKFTKFMGKKFIITGVIMGALGAKMLGIMGTVMVTASALWAGIVATVIAAWPFIVGGLIVAGIVGIGYYIYKQWSTIKESWNEYIVQPIVDFMISAVDKFKSLKETITNAVSGFFDSIISGARSAIEVLPYGEKLASSLFGEKAPVESSDKSQTLISSPEMIKERTIIKENNEEDKKAMKKLNKTLDELSVNINRQQQPVTPVPQSNLDDLGTYLVTLGG